MVASGQCAGRVRPSLTPSNTRPTFWNTPCQESCLHTPGAFPHSQALQLFQAPSQACWAAFLSPLLPLLPQGAQPHPKWPPSHLHPRSPGSGWRARNSIGTTNSHLESWGKSIP